MRNKTVKKTSIRALSCFSEFNIEISNYLKMIHTLQAFCKGSKNDDLKSLTAFPSEVPLHAANKQVAISIRRWSNDFNNQTGLFKYKINIPPLTSALKPSLLSSSRSCGVTNQYIRIHINIKCPVNSNLIIKYC